MDLHLAWKNLEPDGTRALIGKLRHTLDGRTEFVAVQRDGVRLFLRQDTFKIREIAGQFAANEQSLAKAEKQMILVSRETQHRVVSGFGGELQDLAHGLARQQRPER